MVHVLEIFSSTISQPKISGKNCITQLLTWLDILATRLLKDLVLMPLIDYQEPAMTGTFGIIPLNANCIMKTI